MVDSRWAGAPLACAQPTGRRRASEGEPPGRAFSALKQRQLAFRLTRQLVEAQFVRADATRTQRLWQEVAALDLDPDRITHLLYAVADHGDTREMEEADGRWRQSQRSPRLTWWAPRLGRLMGKGAAVWHQTVPPAMTPGHP
ncbi:MAG: hypothetical protein VKP70_04555 [Cyanobacteriota bacterium]|nr:hypothetical protein [Cyanobacteriota bacterium]